ncbi:RsmB/NOP family class I SAM-dependent RNA methyltransferase [Corynebacterium dentalis]|uniref:RsmB/NOP family class I SAM-dependent RNA methyltransferase n=1 Tax=Corynebacterium dentalis TaxID=2014528 RepID=UPI002597BE60|nr:transcription antitermination factor NusB [Corynebacterium dentalis]
MGGFRSRAESSQPQEPERKNAGHDSSGRNQSGPNQSGRNSSPDKRTAGSSDDGRSGQRSASGKNSTRRNDRNGKASKGYQQRRPEHRQAKARQAGSGDKARDVALSVLREVTVNEAFANLVLPRAIKDANLTGRDAAFATELTYGTLRATGLLDAIIAEAAGRPVDKIDSVALDILRLGVYQILRTRVDDHAAVNTSVELAKANAAGQASGFINGVLRTITRTSAEKWINKVAGGSELEDLALRNAHPAWIAQAFNDALHHRADAQEIHPELEAALEADDKRPVVHLAARPGQISAEELALVTGGEEGTWSPYAVYLEEGAPGELEPVRDGLASVQDEGSQMIALALARAPLNRDDAGRWLDLCAGPGGKTAFLGSWAQGDSATVDAVELASHRATLVKNSTKGLPVRVHTGDGRDVTSVAGLDAPDEGFDRVLVDAPCSGLGALRRRPEARWRKAATDIPELVSLQRELLRSAIKATAPGGVVIYSTCSPHLKETSAVVRFVAEETGLETLNLFDVLPELTNEGASAAGPFVQMWPHKHGTDAMFIAALRKPLPIYTPA